MRFVLDCSVIMAWCFIDEKNDYSDFVLKSVDKNEIIVPSIWYLEVVNVLLVAERKKRIKEADCIRFLALLDNLPIIEDEDPIKNRQKNIFSLGHEYNLSSYDAMYLELAIHSDIPLATQDTDLINACRMSGCAYYKE